MSNITWSYSSIKTFDQCPKKYYHLKIIKDVKDEGSEATIYGTEVHKAAEEYIKIGAAIPPKFKFIEATVDGLSKIPGEKHCELKLGVRKTATGYEPCGFFDEGVWWRGIADLVIVNGKLGFSIDYKTSKNSKYADMKQLDVLAGALFVHFPQLERIKSALAFLVSNEFIHKEHFSDRRDIYLDTFTPELERLAGAQESGVWNANTGPLCKFCPVVACEHNRKR
jgi:hypothetical protein